jgi:hypothetical protein
MEKNIKVYIEKIKNTNYRFLNILMILAYLLAGFIFLNKLEIGEYHLFNLENDNNYELMRLFIGGMIGVGIIIQSIIIGSEKLSNHKVERLIKMNRQQVMR